MKKLIIFLLAVGSQNLFAIGGGDLKATPAGGIIVTETDQDPKARVLILRFNNGQVTVDGSTATINITGGGGSETAYPDVIVSSSPLNNTKTSNPLYISSLEIQGDMYALNLYR